MGVARRRIGVTPGRRRVCACIPARLTPREREVLELLAAGMSSATIAGELYLSEQAVTYHVANLISKFQCPSRTGVVTRAFVLGFLTQTWPPEAVDAPVAEPRCAPSLCLHENIAPNRTQRGLGALPS